MSVRLPLPRKDVGKWGALLNKFLRISHKDDGTLKVGALQTSFGTGLLLDDTVLKASAVLQKYHAIDPSANVQTLLGADDFAAFNTSLGLGTGDGPTFDDLTLSSPSNIYALSHDSFADFAANEHIDWTAASDGFLTSGSLGAGAATLSGNLVVDKLNAGIIADNSGDGSTSYPRFQLYHGGASRVSIYWHESVDDLIIQSLGGASDGEIVFQTGGATERLRIDASGNLVTQATGLVIDVGTPTLTIDESGGGHPRLTSSSGSIEFAGANFVNVAALSITSLIIGINTLDTNEWAVLDGVTADMVLDWTGASVGTIDATNIEDKFLRNDGDDVSSGGLTLGGDLVMGGNDIQNANIYVTTNLYHYGDLDTGLIFGGDTFYFIAGGLEMLKCVEVDKGSDEVVINENGVDIDFRVEAVGQANALFVQGSDGKVGIRDGTPGSVFDVTGDVNTTENYKVDDVQVVSNRVIDERCDDAINSGDATTDGVIDALRDAMIAHGLIAAA